MSGVTEFGSHPTKDLKMIESDGKGTRQKAVRSKGTGIKAGAVRGRGHPAKNGKIIGVKIERWYDPEADQLPTAGAVV